MLKLLNWQLKLLTIQNNEGKKEVGIEKVDILTNIPKKDFVNEIVDSHKSIEKVEE